ncbi:MAG TPA: beta-ketoacyl synthase chain length factor [Fulvivirga sp.]|nr:beta-ketoacyl synthase chain length factor [Fulvivirga sp.]
MRAYIKSTSAICAQQTFDKSEYLAEYIAPEGQYLKATEPPYRGIIDPKQIRRMSRIIKMSVATAHQALAEAEVQVPEAIIVGTGLGCIEDTIKFLKDIIEGEEGILSPTAFIQSTHNTIAGQIALLLQCPNYNFTYANRGHSFENSVIDARIQLSEGKDNILVGAAEEMNLQAFEIMYNMGCTGDRNKNDGSALGEGASFFVLTNEQKEGRPYLQDISVSNHITAEQLEKSLNSFLAKNKVDASDVDLLLMGSNEFEKDGFYEKIASLFADNTPQLDFKKICGEHFTASGFAMHLGTMILQDQVSLNNSYLAPQLKRPVRKILIYNHYKAMNHTFMLLSI